MAHNQNERDERNKHDERTNGLPTIVRRRARRKLAARRRGRDPIWRGLGAMGMVGWSVAIPTILGVFLGLYIDRRWPESPIPWTLTLLLTGLAAGVFIAWKWIEEERNEIGRGRRFDDE
jgi:ATP synthase protein I